MTLPLNPPPGPVSLSANARTVLEKRYLVKNEKGKPVEQPEDLFWRVATVSPRRIGDTERPRAR
jgi:ribonucleoside-diphosphate reductase alpha chain